MEADAGANMGGSIMVTMKDIAKRARVSVTTVSHVLNGSRYVSVELKERVERTIEELNYQPNLLGRGLRKGQSHSVALVVSDITNPFFPQIAKGVEDHLKKHGYSLILYNTNEDPREEKEGLSHLRARRIDGFIIAPTKTGHQDLVLFVEDKIPLVVIDRRVEGLGVDQVYSDNLNGTVRAVRYLAGLGHQRIGFVGGLSGITSTDDRLEGYKQAIVGLGLSVNPCFVVPSDSRVMQSGYDAACRLIQQDVTAIFCVNSVTMMGVMRCLKEKGLACPEHISVVGFDDPQWALAFTPSLTVVAHSPYQMGYRAVNLLLERLAHASRKFQRVILPTTLKVRESTGQPLK